MLALVTLLAQVAETAKTTGGEAAKAPGTGIDLFVLFGAPLILFFLLIILPQRRDAKLRREMLATLKKGDRVLVNGFLIGTVVQIINPDKPQAEGEVVLRSEDNARLRVLRGSINRILKSDEVKDAKEGS